MGLVCLLLVVVGFSFFVISSCGFKLKKKMSFFASSFPPVEIHESGCVSASESVRNLFQIIGRNGEEVNTRNIDTRNDSVQSIQENNISRQR